MAELFPDDPKLSHFTARYSSENFNPIAAPIIVSPAVQLRPKQIMQSIESRGSVLNSPRPSVRQPNSPRPTFMPSINSPKRPLQVDDFEESLNPPRKIQRGESPLKGAAGRRLGEQRRVQATPLARDISFILGLIPPATTYTIPRFSAHNMVRLLRDTPVPDFKSWKEQGPRGDKGPMQMAQHNRQISSDQSQYPYQGSGRPQSPFDVSRGRIASAASTYGQSSLRPGSSGSAYEPPPAVYRQDGPPVGYPMPTPDGNGVWVPPPPPQPQMYGAPNPSDYAVPSPYGQAAPQQPQYPRYY